MKLNHDEFVALLARAMESDEGEASKALGAWVESVVREAEESGSCYVEGLGTFRKKEDGSMDYQPAETLALEVNHKYAGLSPIEVSPPKPGLVDSADEETADTEGEPAAEEADEGDDPFGIAGYREEELPEEEPDARYGEKTDAEREDDREPADEFDREEEPEGEQELEPWEKEEREFEPEDEAGVDPEIEPEIDPEIEPEIDPEIEPEIDPEIEPDEESEPAFSESLQPEDTESSSRPFLLPRLSLSQRLKTRGGASKNRRSGKSEKLMWLIPVAALLIVAILLYFHFDGQRLSRVHIDDRPVVQNEIPVPAPREDREEEQVVQEFVPSPEPVEDVAPPPDVDVTPEPVEDVAADPADEVIRNMALPYGLRGPEDEVLIGAYTIVVHSLRNERKSEIEQRRLENQGYKATRWETVLPNGNTTYRVGVGQFKTVSDAERAIEELPEPFRSNNFIIRIR